MTEVARFRGTVLESGDGAYDEMRAVWNGAIDRRPSAILRCAGAADVMAAVRHTRERGLAATVRSGGHGVGGQAVQDGAVMIDLSSMKGIRVDPAAGTVSVQAGVVLGELDHETQAFGLAVPAGIVTHTGVAGLTLGGGIGWLMRKHGLTIDSMTAADVVTADGELVHADADRDAELFWGLRGGGGNFGIVTSFEFRAHPVGPEIYGGPILWAMEDGVDALRLYRDFIAQAPEELTCIVNLRRAPSWPTIPAELHGRHIIQIGTCFAGPLEEGERVLAPLRAHGRPLLDLIGSRPFVALQAANDPAVPHGWGYYWKSSDFAGLDDALIESIISSALKVPNAKSYALLFQLGGAIARVGENETAYSHRHALHAININAAWGPGEPEADETIAWVRRFFDETSPHQIGAYVNFMMEEGKERVHLAYGAEKYARLVDLKTRLDPTNFFRFNQNIEPRAV